MATNKGKRAGKAPAKAAGIGDDAVKAKTGRTWTEWVSALDDAGARSMAHAGIATLVAETFGVQPWWSQMVTVGYEQLTGRRVAMQKADGFAASVSRTLDLSASATFKAFNDPRTRVRWLRDAITITKATSPKSVRGEWKDGTTRLDVNIYAKGARKAQVSLQHTRLGSAREVTRMKAYWASAFERLKESLATK